jgi:hypothetical protein
VFTLATGIAVKYPVFLSGTPPSQGESAFRINRHIVTGTVPVVLQTLAGTAGSFWYNHETGQIQEELDVRNKHVVDGSTISGVKITIIDHACIPTSQWITAPEFSQYIPGNGCIGTPAIPARTIGAWLKIGTTGVENIALPQNDSFSLISIMNMVSVAFYLIVTVSSFRQTTLRLPQNTETKVARTFAIATGLALIYAASVDVISDTQCTQAEAAIVAFPMTLFLMLAGKSLRLQSTDIFNIVNTKLLIVSSISLSLSISVVDYSNTKDMYSLTACIINSIAVLVVLLIISKSNNGTPWQITRFERSIVEIAIISSLRLLVHNELGELFALATALTTAVITSKYCLPQQPSPIQ